MSEQSKKINAIEKAKGHYQSQIKEMRSFEVPEWDLTIYHRTITSLALEAEVVELARQNKTVEAMVVTIINKARNEDGSLMFNKHDKQTLMREVDPAVVLRIAEKINGGALPSLEELEKN